jgi:hypothetical protein
VNGKPLWAGAELALVEMRGIDIDAISYCKNSLFAIRPTPDIA